MSWHFDNARISASPLLFEHMGRLWAWFPICPQTGRWVPDAT